MRNLRAKNGKSLDDETLVLADEIDVSKLHKLNRCSKKVMAAYVVHFDWSMSLVNRTSPKKYRVLDWKLGWSPAKLFCFHGADVSINLSNLLYLFPLYTIQNVF